VGHAGSPGSGGRPAAVPGAAERAAIPIRGEVDIVEARQAARAMCERLGFSVAIQTRVATVVSELARNIVHYAGDGEVRLAALRGSRPGIEVVAEDRGPGIPHLDAVLRGEHRSTRGMGMGLRGTRNVMDEFDVQTGAGEGTRVTARLFGR